jgi:hypothetical protein
MDKVLITGFFAKTLPDTTAYPPLQKGVILSLLVLPWLIQDYAGIRF